MYQVFEDKLLEFAERQPEKIAEQWCKAIRKNSRTPSFHNLEEGKYLPVIINCYKSLKNIYHSSH